MVRYRFDIFPSGRCGRIYALLPRQRQKFIAAVDRVLIGNLGAKDLDSLVFSAAERISEMASGDEVLSRQQTKPAGCICKQRRKAIPFRETSAAWKVFASGRPYLTPRVESGKDLPFCGDARSTYVHPLCAEGEKIGVLQVESMVPDAFSEEDLQKLELIAFVLSHPLYVKLSAEKNDTDEEEAGGK